MVIDISGKTYEARKREAGDSSRWSKRMSLTCHLTEDKE